MALNTEALQRDLCKRLCQEVRIAERPDGLLMLETNFRFPDGDHFPFHVVELQEGGLRLTDHGHTLMQISYDHDIDSFLQGTRGQLLEKTMAETGLEWESGSFYIDTPIRGLHEAIFRFGQALTRVYDLTFLSRSHVRSTFYEDLADLIVTLVADHKIQKDYVPEGVPNPEAYSVDYRIASDPNSPLFLFGVPNRDKARLTTIMLSHFNRHKLKFDSLIVFEDQSEIPRLDLARLSDAGGGMISSLESSEDLQRKILHHIAR